MTMARVAVAKMELVRIVNEDDDDDCCGYDEEYDGDGGGDDVDDYDGVAVHDNCFQADVKAECPCCYQAYPRLR